MLDFDELLMQYHKQVLCLTSFIHLSGSATLETSSGGAYGYEHA